MSSIYRGDEWSVPNLQRMKRSRSFWVHCYILQNLFIIRLIGLFLDWVRIKIKNSLYVSVLLSFSSIHNASTCSQDSEEENRIRNQTWYYSAVSPGLRKTSAHKREDLIIFLSKNCSVNVRLKCSVSRASLCVHQTIGVWV